MIVFYYTINSECWSFWIDECLLSIRYFVWEEFFAIGRATFAWDLHHCWIIFIFFIAAPAVVKRYFNAWIYVANGEYTDSFPTIDHPNVWYSIGGAWVVCKPCFVSINRAVDIIALSQWNHVHLWWCFVFVARNKLIGIDHIANIFDDELASCDSFICEKTVAFVASWFHYCPAELSFLKSLV